MPNSLRCKIKKWCYQGKITEKDRDRLIKGLDINDEALDFARWVAEEIMDEELWELNSSAFPEIACRKLEKLGIVKSNDGCWEVSE